MAWTNVVSFSDIEIAGIGMTSQRTRNRMVLRLQQQGISDQRVLDVMSRTPRHLFMDEAIASRAYEDVALPIGGGQTISQPYIVAKMTEILLSSGNPKTVLEVGTGSGYQAAILSQLSHHVYTCERISHLHRKAIKRYACLGYKNIECTYSDGSWGWPERGPFDAIIVTAAAREIPDALQQQLAVGGVLVCPVGRQEGTQILTVLTRDKSGISTETKEIVKFVPFLTGKS